jgi:hypothetical protein
MALDDSELNALAVEELLKEAKRGKIRAEQVGALGWQKCPLPTVNRRFVGTMVLGTVSERRREKERRKNGKRYQHEETASSTDRRRETEKRTRALQVETRRDGAKKRKKFADEVKPSNRRSGQHEKAKRKSPKCTKPENEG